MSAAHSEKMIFKTLPSKWAHNLSLLIWRCHVCLLRFLLLDQTYVSFNLLTIKEKKIHWWVHETEGRLGQLTQGNKARQWEMERGSWGQGARLPMEARRCRMGTVNTERETVRENSGEQRWRGKENTRKLWRGTVWVWSGRSEMCRGPGILKEK